MFKKDGDLDKSSINKGDGNKDYSQMFQTSLQIAKAHEQAYLSTGETDYLSQAILAWQHLTNHPSFSNTSKQLQLRILYGSGHTLLHSFRASGNPVDLDQAVNQLQQATRLSTSGTLILPAAFTNLGIGLKNRFHFAGQVSDLDESISAHKQAIELTPSSSPNLPFRLSNLGDGFITRFQFAGQASDLHNAISILQQASQLTSYDSTMLARILLKLGTGLGMRFQLTGQPSDLHEAVSILKQVVQHTSSDSFDLPFHLSGLGNALWIRYQFLGQISDLDEAILAFQQAIQITPSQSPNLPYVLHSLGRGLGVRFRLTGLAADLHESISAHEQSLQLAPSSSTFLPLYLDNLGQGLGMRFQLSGQISDLHKAISLFQQAVQLTPSNSPNLPQFLNSLGNSLGDRYKRNGQESDLHEAISLSQQAVQLTPGNSPELPIRVNSLGIGLRERFHFTGQITDLHKAIQQWQTGLNWFYERMPLDNNISAMAEKAIPFTWQLVSAQLILGQTTLAMEMVEQSKAIGLRQLLSRTNRTPTNLPPKQIANYISLVKEARKIQARQRHLFRQDSPLPKRDEELAELHKQYTSHLKQIHAFEERDPLFSLTPPDYTTLYKLAQDQNVSLVYLQPLQEETALFIIYPNGNPAEPNVLRLSDFSLNDLHNLLFQQPDTVSSINRDSIPAYLDAAESDETFGWFTAYWFSQLAYTAKTAFADYRLQAVWQETMARILQDLSSVLIVPLAEQLTELGAERVVLLPGGRLALLPLHAVPVGDDGACLGDKFAVSYAPSAVFLAQALKRSAQREAGKPTLTAIGNPDGSLVFTPDEVAGIAERFAPEQRHVAFGAQASSGWVHEYAPLADYVNLSTHASFYSGDPGRSSFILAHPKGHTVHSHPDLGKLQAECERLTLDQLWAGDLTLKPGCLVTASACETAQMDPDDTVDEGLGFPPGFLAAEASTVVATFWSVEDFATALYMDKLYELLLPPNGLAPAKAAQQAAQWLRRLTKDEVVKRLRAELEPLQAEAKSGQWATLDDESHAANYHRLTGLSDRLRSLERGADKPFEHPYYWAAFGVHGAG